MHPHHFRSWESFLTPTHTLFTIPFGRVKCYFILFCFILFKFFFSTESRAVIKLFFFPIFFSFILFFIVIHRASSVQHSIQFVMLVKLAEQLICFCPLPGFEFSNFLSCGNGAC